MLLEGGMLKFQFFFIFTALLCIGSWTLTLASPRPFRVVIDPGHGGNDQGALFKNAREEVAEKDLTLLLAREVAKKLKAMGNVAILTRNNDQDVPLTARTALANRLNADIFLSIHMNSIASHSQGPAEGMETYILNNSTSETSKRLATLENSVLKGSVAQQGDSSDVSLILKDLRLDANLAESKRLACAIQNQIVLPTRTVKAQTVNVRDRGIKQALFYVLLGADMPSVLVEAGFISNSKDRNRVQTTQGRSSLSTAIARAIEQYWVAKASPISRSRLNKCKVTEQ